MFPDIGLVIHGDLPTLEESLQAGKWRRGFGRQQGLAASSLKRVASTHVSNALLAVPSRGHIRWTPPPSSRASSRDHRDHGDEMKGYF